MRRESAIFICLLFICHGRRVQPTSNNDSSSISSKEIKALKLLLISNSLLTGHVIPIMRTSVARSPNIGMALQLEANSNVATAPPGLLVLGLNPAWQTIMSLNKLDLGQVNRAVDARPGVGGKGQNAAKAAAKWLEHSSDEQVQRNFGVTVAQFLGGATGDQIRLHLQNMRIADISAVTSAATRQTVTLLDYPDPASKPTVTELITPSEAVPGDAVSDLQAKLVAEAPEHRGILLMGTWPNGVSKEVYIETAKAKGAGAVVLMDAFQPTDEVAAILAGGAVDVYKVNAFEICTMMGSENLKEGEVTLEQITDAVTRAFAKFAGVRYFAITDGPDSAFLFSREPREAFSFRIPKVTCLNPIGAGDTVAGVTMAAFCSSANGNMQDAMHLGLAAAVAKVQNVTEGGVFDIDAMLEAKAKIECTPISFEP